MSQPHPRDAVDSVELRRFAQHAKGGASLVLLKHLAFDPLHPVSRVPQRALAPTAHAQYRTLFRPTPAFVAAACTHLDALNLRLGRPWVGLQLRRKLDKLQSRQSRLGGLASPGGNGTYRWQDEPALSERDKAGVAKAVACALSARNASCGRGGEGALCGAPVFLTSNSYRCLRYGARLLGERDARWAADPTFGVHGGPNVQLQPLLEMAVLSASAVIVGSAGSSYPLEAANLANTSAIVKDFGLYNVPEALRKATLQGDCAAPPPPGESLLLPRGACGQ